MHIQRHILDVHHMDSQVFCFPPDRCALNATPQMMSGAAGQLEDFMINIAANKKLRKDVRPNITEV